MTADRQTGRQSDSRQADRVTADRQSDSRQADRVTADRQEETECR